MSELSYERPWRVIYEYGWRLGLLYLLGRVLLRLLLVAWVLASPFVIFTLVIILIPLLNR
jgi:hypothetical protein